MAERVDTGTPAGKATGRKPKATDLDPRPDLEQDHRMWVAVLALTWERNPKLHGLLHGLRCAGCRLERLRNGRYKLDVSTVEGWSRDELLPWLMPWRDDLAKVFQQAPGLERRANEELRRRQRQAG